MQQGKVKSFETGREVGIKNATKTLVSVLQDENIMDSMVFSDDQRSWLQGFWSGVHTMRVQQEVRE